MVDNYKELESSARNNEIGKNDNNNFSNKTNADGAFRANRILKCVIVLDKVKSTKRMWLILEKSEMQNPTYSSKIAKLKNSNRQKRNT